MKRENRVRIIRWDGTVAVGGQHGGESCPVLKGVSVRQPSEEEKAQGREGKGREKREGNGKKKRKGKEKGKVRKRKTTALVLGGQGEWQE